MHLKFTSLSLITKVGKFISLLFKGHYASFSLTAHSCEHITFEEVVLQSEVNINLPQNIYLGGNCKTLLRALEVMFSGIIFLPQCRKVVLQRFY